MDNKRAHERLSEENRVAVTIIKSVNSPQLEDQTFFCPTGDISEGGMRLSVPSPFPIAAELELRVAFAKPLCSFKHQGEVRWCREDPGKFPYSIGVQFVTEDDADRDKWSMFMSRKLASSD